MADVVTSEKRSRMMSGIRGKNTRPELLIRRGLHKLGFRFRLHDSSLPGKPDIVFSRYKAVVMVHGCFWHGHECLLFKWPSSRTSFWESKIKGNKANDVVVLKTLLQSGWRVLIIWECATKGKGKWPLDKIMALTADWLTGVSGYSEIRGDYAC